MPAQTGAAASETPRNASAGFSFEVDGAAASSVARQRQRGAPTRPSQVARHGARPDTQNTARTAARARALVPTRNKEIRAGRVAVLVFEPQRLRVAGAARVILEIRRDAAGAVHVRERPTSDDPPAPERPRRRLRFTPAGPTGAREFADGAVARAAKSCRPGVRC